MCGSFGHYSGYPRPLPVGTRRTHRPEEAAIVSSRRLGRVLVRGRSMEPTLYDGDHQVVLYGGRPRPGRLAVVRLPGPPLSVKGPAFIAVVVGWGVERDNPTLADVSWQVGS